MAEYLIQSETLDDIADAINAKTGGSAAMTPAEMVTAIGSISGGGLRLWQGTYIDVGSDTRSSITIPTNATGINPLFIYLQRRETGAETTRGYHVSNLTAWSPDGAITTPLSKVGTSFAKRLGNDDTYSNVSQSYTSLFDGATGEIKIGTFNNYYYWMSGTYDWYIWGVAE